MRCLTFKRRVQAFLRITKRAERDVSEEISTLIPHDPDELEEIEEEPTAKAKPEGTELPTLSGPEEFKMPTPPKVEPITMPVFEVLEEDEHDEFEGPEGRIK